MTDLVARLRSFLGDYLEAHGAESRGARADLERLNGLLADAGMRLAASFAEIHALATRQQEMALGIAQASPGARCMRAEAAANDSPGCQTVAIPATARAVPDRVGAPDLGAVTRDIERAVHEVVTALQFQDIATQLVGHTAARLEVLDRMAGQLTRLPDVTADELYEALAAARGARRGSPVGQAHMSAGGVELF